MKKEKLLSSLAATSLVLTQAGQLSVFAEENNNSVIEPATSEKETTTIEKTEKEFLHSTPSDIILRSNIVLSLIHISEPTRPY